LQRRAKTGIALVHSGHSLVSGSFFARLFIRALTGATTKKKIGVSRSVTSCLHDGGKRRADHDRHGQIEDVPSAHEAA